MILVGGNGFHCILIWVLLSMRLYDGIEAEGAVFELEHLSSSSCDGGRRPAGQQVLRTMQGGMDEGAPHLAGLLQKTTLLSASAASKEPDLHLRYLHG